MSQSQSNQLAAVPRWIMIVGSVAIAGHLVAVLAMVLAAQSGPWFTPMGPSSALPPPFAESINEVASPNYLRWIKMTNDYHFASNRPALPAAIFEVRLKDQDGKELAILKFPDGKANFWVRHRQSMLARALADDQPVQPTQGELIPAPGQQVHTVQIWDGEPQHQQLRTVPEHLIPRERPVFRPSEWSLLLAKSYARFLCRTHGAASAEVIRHTRESLSPMIWRGFNPPPESTNDFVAHFGDFKP